MLFGASAVLILEQYAKRSNLDSAAEFYFRRLIVLFLFGMFNAYILLWSGDILYTYSIAGMFIFPLYRLSNKRLLIIAVVVITLSCMRSTWMSHRPIRLKEAADAAMAVDTTIKPLTQSQQLDIQAWKTFLDEGTIKNKRIIDEDQIARTLGDFGTFFMYSAGITYFLQTDLFYNFFFLDAFSFMLIGIVLFRSGILSGMRSKRF